VCRRLALARFPFGQIDSSHKPRPMSERLLSDGQIIGEAVEKWTLLRTIPLIIGNKISKSDKNWQPILCLSNIAEILLAPTVSIHWISPLAELITSFLTVFKSYQHSSKYLLCSTEERICSLQFAIWG